MMAELEARLLAIKASLYLLLAAFLCILMATLFLALRQKAEDAKMSGGWCGTCHPPVARSAAYIRGKELFIVNCASCHNRNMRDDLTGPALGDVEKRWAGFPRKDLYNYIRRSQSMVRTKHPRALELWKAWKPAVMNDFLPLTDQEIEDVLAYIQSR